MSSWTAYFTQTLQQYQKIHDWIRHCKIDKDTYTQIYRYAIIRKLTKALKPLDHFQSLNTLNQYIEDLADQALEEMPKELKHLLTCFAVAFQSDLTNWETAQSAAHG